jgi:hypothetical protein
MFYKHVLKHEILVHWFEWIVKLYLKQGALVEWNYKSPVHIQVNIAMLPIRPPQLFGGKTLKPESNFHIILPLSAFKWEQIAYDFKL